jgi:cobalt-zinc-cadmium efflux system outer membrane protein
MLAACLGAAAQDALTAAQAVADALSAHPLLVAAAERVSASQAYRQQAALRPNPRFMYQTENLRVPVNTPFVALRDTDNFAFLQQTFETAGKRELRTGLAGARVRVAEAETALLRRQVATRVLLAYWAAAGALRVHELLLESQATFQQVVEYHEIRVREGAMAESDHLRVRLEAERIALEANNAFLEAQRARIHLFREMGRAQFPAARFDPLELAADRLIPADPEQALPRRPELVLAREQLDQARSALAVQRSLARPNLDALFGYKRTGGIDTALVGLQIDLPAFNRNQGNIGAAGAEVRAAEANLAAAEALIRAEIAAAGADYEVRRKRVQETLGRLRQQAAETSQIALAAYREGGADLLRLLDAQRLRIDIEVLSFRALTEYRQSIVALETALGVTP